MTRILIIEDEESYRDATAFMLRKEGFEVLTAEDGRPGWRRTTGRGPTWCCST